MTGSLKRHPSGEPEESPKAKRHPPAEQAALPPAEPEEDDTPAPKGTVTSEEKEEDPAPSFLSPPTKVGGFSITDKANITDDKATTNGNSNSIINSGFKLSTGASVFSNGSVEGSSTNIFSAALTNVNSGGGIFGSSSAGSSFVFGANLSDRVVSKKGEEKEGSSDSAPAESEEPPAVDKLALVEAKVTSGEEDEKRIIQTTCKLYQFCAQSKSWVERGGGTLRLNEKACGDRSTSRLVVRSKAVMKVMLNTKMFADMIINRANLTTIRISALDNGKMGTFLLKCTRNECDRLHTVLLKRREIERRNDEEFGGESSKSGGTENANNSKNDAQKPSADLTSSKILDNEKTTDDKTTDEKTTDEKKTDETKKEETIGEEAVHKNDDEQGNEKPEEMEEETDKKTDEKEEKLKEEAPKENDDEPKTEKTSKEEEKSSDKTTTEQADLQKQASSTVTTNEDSTAPATSGAKSEERKTTPSPDEPVKLKESEEPDKEVLDQPDSEQTSGVP